MYRLAGDTISYLANEVPKRTHHIPVLSGTFAKCQIVLSGETSEEFLAGFAAALDWSRGTYNNICQQAHIEIQPTVFSNNQMAMIMAAATLLQQVKGKTITVDLNLWESLLATFQLIANTSDDPAVLEICEEALQRALGDELPPGPDQVKAEHDAWVADQEIAAASLWEAN